MIIGISGKIGSGKDTVGMIIQALTMGPNSGRYKNDPVLYLKNYEGKPNLKGGWQIKKFAGKLKQIVSILTGIPVKDLERQVVKNSSLGPEWNRYPCYSNPHSIHATAPYPYIPKEEMTVRTLLQEVGTDAMREVIHPNIWVNALFADYDIGLIGKPYDTVLRSTSKDVGDDWIITDLRFPNEAQAILDRGGILIRINRGITSNKSGEHISETMLDSYENFTEIIENNGTIEELVLKTKVVLQKHKLIN